MLLHFIQWVGRFVREVWGNSSVLYMDSMPGEFLLTKKRGKYIYNSCDTILSLLLMTLSNLLLYPLRYNKCDPWLKICVCKQINFKVSTKSFQKEILA